MYTYEFKCVIFLYSWLKLIIPPQGMISAFVMWLFHFPFKLLRYGFCACFPSNQIVVFQILWIDLFSSKRFHTLKCISVLKSVCLEPHNPFHEHNTKSISEWPVVVLQSAWRSNMLRNKRVKLNCLNCTMCLSRFAVRGQRELYFFVVQRCLAKVTQALRCLRFQKHVSTFRYLCLNTSLGFPFLSDFYISVQKSKMLTKPLLWYWNT